MSDLSIFRFDGADVRTVVIDGEPWFVARDACEVLGISKYRDAVAQLEADERASAAVDTLGGAQQMAVVNEAGVYALMLISRSPSARAFQRWLTHDVVPSIRKSGSYTAPKSQIDIIREQHASIGHLLAEVESKTARVAELEPVAAHAETFRQADGLRTVGDVANDFKAHCAANLPTVKVRHQDVWAHAARLGIVIRGESVRHNQPTAQAIEAGWARAHRTTYETNTRGVQTATTTRLTPRGEARLWDGLAAYVGKHGSLDLEVHA